MPPTGRYQSRVLSFLFQRSRQWVDQCEVALRHAKVATLWGVQVLLSPLYLIRQGGWRRFGQPLGGGSVAAAGLPEAGEVPPPPNPALSPDEGPVLEVLQVVEQWRSLSATSSLPPADGALVTGSSGAIAPQGVAVRGIASCLVSRQLVLVNADNQGLEGLTPFEQRLLKQQIWLAIALFASRQWVRPRLQGAAAALQGALRPLGQQVSRWAVGRLGGAVPMGAIAPQEVFERPELAASSGAIAPAAQPGSYWLERAGKAALLVRQHFAKAIAGVLTLRRPAVGADLALPAPEPQRSHQVSQNSSTPEPGNLKPFGAIAPYGGLSRGPAAAVASLLQAAVAYFFGDRPPQPQLPAALPDLPASPPPKPLLGRVWQAIAPSAFGPEQVPTLTVDDPWLTAEDLFGVQPPVEHQPATADSVPQALPSAPRLSLPSSIRHWLRRIALNSTTDLALPPDSPSPAPQIQPQNWGRWLVPRSQSLSKAPSASLPVVAASAGINAPAAPRPEPSASGSFEHWLAALDDLGLTPNPDWIEASATPSGYVKHPLETLLDWFDRLLLWIEERVIAGFRWLSRFWKP